MTIYVIGYAAGTLSGVVLATTVLILSRKAQTLVNGLINKIDRLRA